MVKFLIFALIAFVAFKLFRRPEDLKKVREEAAPKPLETAVDPISGTYVSKDTDFKVKLYDKIYYFDSKESMDKFIAQKTGEENETVS
ncbi:hypothetical protein [Seleniivibrio woodruffii]|uniref:YHS domain-containing protein n=1 Tax=Seleniivibrio woodruffii TaxID=1078050 RepID=A0A4R1KAU5_9BACT|nr:hypothetical protein [Seleniivibrio woodruffii]TCK61562.1 hypothetical protein C8D98_0063 [Seleniivibrio woodruffii]TVZ35323.1 hypothetical protein OF66_0930 [Seleniivibrio woodruffii]